jgi:outer membrane protein TolC
MRIRIRFGLRPLAFALCSAATLAQPAFAALDLDRALLLAQQRSRQLPAQEAAAASAREMAVAAGQLPDPVLKAGINNLPVNGPDRFSLTNDFMTMRSIGVMQEFTRGDKLRARSARFEHEALAAGAARQLALANLQRDTAIAWLELFYQQRMRELLVRQREEAALQVQAADAAYRGNRAPQSDVFATRSALAQLDDRIAASDRDIAAARTMLVRWVGGAASEPLGNAPSLDRVSLRDEELDTTLLHHPQIAQMLEQEAAAQADVDAAKANKKVDPTVELMYNQRGPAYSNMVSVNVSIPLQWNERNRQDREVAAKLATLEQLRAQREEETRMHVAEARSMLQQWRANRDRLRRYDESLLPLAADRMRAALAAYRGGTAPLANVLDARRMELDTRLEQLRLELDTARLWAQLNFLVPATHTAQEARP